MSSDRVHSGIQPDGVAPVAILLPNFRGGGAERISVYLANELSARGYAVDIVVMRAEGELLHLVDDRVRIVDLEVARLRHVGRALASYLRRERPLGLVAHMWPLTVIAALAVRLFAPGTRLIVVEHTNWTRTSHRDSRFLQFKRRASMKLCLPWADEIVCVSHGVARDLESYAWLGKHSVRCIYNPVTGLPSRSSVDLASGFVDEWSSGSHKKLISVGTLKDEKRFDVLIEGFARLSARADVRLLILGEGSLRGALENQVQMLGLQQRVSMPGFLHNPEALLREADLFVLSSSHEGLPTVLIEALEQGIPVVSTDCPSGPDEILEGGKYGTLVPVGDVDALAKAMEDALGRKHDQAALKRRAQDFSVDKAADAYLDLLLPGWREAPSSNAEKQDLRRSSCTPNIV